MANKNLSKLDSFPSDKKKIFLDFIAKVNEEGYWVNITSAKRSYQEQASLKKENSKNAAPGTSPHEFFKAIDINIVNKISGNTYLKRTSKNTWINSRVPSIAKSFGIKWGGDFSGYADNVHFELKNARKGDDSKTNDDSNYKKYKNNENWSIEVGKPAIEDEAIEDEVKKVEEYITKISEVETKDAVGIWQIVKLVADQYSLSQNVNDASIAFSQGSLLNYIQKVVQKPWLQFFGDTVGDQYYFQCRKEPFDFDGYNELPIIKSIQENEVLSDDIAWFDGDIFSWYQIIPKGSFLGEQDLIFAYVKAVFFEEYAEIWGSKPNIQVSNYLNFNKIDEDNKMFSKAIDDLRYMVESNAYLPFSREGTIVISGDNTIRRGYKIYYEPTGEFFYIDSVSHNYSVDDNGPSYTTTLRVSRGVIKKYFNKYFEIINFDNPPPLIQEYDEEIKDYGILLYYDNGRNYLIDLDEDFSKSTSGTDIKMVNQIGQYPDLRKELYQKNQTNISQIAELIHRHKDQQFICQGNMDEDAKEKFSKLSKRRAETMKSLVISEYMKKYSDVTAADLSSRISIQANQDANTPYLMSDSGALSVYDDNTEDVDLKEKAYKRNSLFYVKPYKQKKNKEIPQKGVAWSVNRKIFYEFFNRKQFVTDVQR